ncbi:hypothetical protein [Pleionea sediminis]|uniref:hypothetical protein n=1 Tax=Pleionea sediminis TaxID=2569479 RepID=UPI001185053D|nr:hypothetical protein [Pleionea sediminis]
MNRRNFLIGAASSAMSLSINSLLTGLSPAFLTAGSTFVRDPLRKFAIIAQSGAGEAVNGCGPGSFDSPDFMHPTKNSTDYVKTIAGTTYTSEDMALTTNFLDGQNPVRIARIFEALGSMQDNMAFFHHRTKLGIHPQFPSAKTAGGAIKGFIGRGEEELVSAIAQENAIAMGCVIDKPIVLSGSATYKGSPLNTYTPTVIKELVTSSINSEVPREMFSAARNHLIDAVYQNIKTNGTPNQKRFLDEYALTQQQADEVASKLLNEVSEINDDSYASQMRMACIIAKLNLAPAAVVSYQLSGDNHISDAMTVEAERTLDMMEAYRDFYDFANSMDVWNQLLYATISVFGRSMNKRANGRNHNGSLSTGLLFGGHLSRKVIGGIDPNISKGVSMPINSSTGGTENPNVSVDDSLACYAKSVLKAAGVPDDRLEERVRDVPAVSLV